MKLPSTIWVYKPGLPDFSTSLAPTLLFQQKQITNYHPVMAEEFLLDSLSN